LKWFEVDPEEWEKPEEEMIMKDENEIVKHPIRRALINERLTHAFEAERYSTLLIFKEYCKVFL